MAKKRLQLAPTTLQLWQTCLRKGAFRTIGKVRTPPNPGMYEGNLGHKHVERYCADGTMPPRDDAGPRQAWEREIAPLLASGAYPYEYEVAVNVWSLPARSQTIYKAWANAYMGRVVGDVIGHLPEPGTSEIEQWVHIDTGQPWIFRGRFDVLDGNHVIDPKFYAASSASKWMLSEAELRANPQCVIYSAWPDTDVSRFTMLYVIKPPRKGGGTAKAKPVTVEMTADEIDRGLDALDEIAEKILWYVQNVSDPNDVPHNADSACEGAGIGCDFNHVCKWWKDA